MLGTALFVVFWLLLGAAVFFVAIRGGLSGARAVFQSQSLGVRRFIGGTFAVVYVGFGVALPIVFLTGNHANANRQVGGIRLTTAEKRGRELFGAHCGVCHTLAAANAVGKVGPNLDTIKPTDSLVLHTIQYGCLQNPPPGSQQSCLGQGTMPANIIQGRDASDVAAFVAKVAGRE